MTVFLSLLEFFLNISDARSLRTTIYCIYLKSFVSVRSEIIACKVDRLLEVIDTNFHLKEWRALKFWQGNAFAVLAEKPRMEIVAKRFNVISIWCHDILRKIVRLCVVTIFVFKYQTTVTYPLKGVLWERGEWAFGVRWGWGAVWGQWGWNELADSARLQPVSSSSAVGVLDKMSILKIALLLPNIVLFVLFCIVSGKFTSFSHTS